MYPDYDIKALALSICKDKSETTGTIWDLKGIYFYTGVPKASDNQYWNEFWEIKLLNMSRNGIKTFQRPLRYSEKATRVSDSEEIIAKIGQEKGIDVRIAVDVIRMALKNEYDVALIFSQDQDLSEVVSEIHDIAKETKRWINVACAYPFSQQSKNKRGINGSDWIQISRIMYKNFVIKCA